MQANRSITDPELIKSKIAEAEDADAFIKENVIQAKKSNCGQYGKACRRCRGWWRASSVPNQSCWVR